MADDVATNPEFLVVGHVSKVHGIKGELYVWPLTDYPDSTFHQGVELEVSDLAGERPSDFFPTLEIDSVRPYKEGFLIKFVGLQDRTEAERFRGRYLMRPFEDVEELEDGEIFYHQLLGMEVVTVDGRHLGTVQEIYEIGQADLIEIRGAEGVVHVPFVESMVPEIDVEAGRLVLDPVEGLLDQ